MKYLKYFLTFAFLLIIHLSLFSQDRMLMMSQYTHNRYMLNPAFGGCRDAFSIFGAYRIQWLGSEYPPNFQALTAHAPMKNENVALGALIFNEKFGPYHGTKVNGSYTYRLFLKSGTKIAFSLNPGVRLANYGMESLDIIDNPDPTFEGWDKAEYDARFSMGFGTAWYGEKFFLGFSVYDFFYRTPFDPDADFFSLGKSALLLTGGYLFRITDTFIFQPSTLVNIVESKHTITDISATLIFGDLLWVGGTWRTNNEFIAMVGWSITPQFKVAYSYDYPTGELKKFNAGSHELSIQFDFGYKIITQSPKFF
ncbi:MAG: PorP/SprF family type IX secretion system membrane protein [Marinilabiliaceae bacterium]|nr:PorP/SprF family type IX secretion system membrane protein [Marinilabiliaceae bacterium]